MQNRRFSKPEQSRCPHYTLAPGFCLFGLFVCLFVSFFSGLLWHRPHLLAHHSAPAARLLLCVQAAESYHDPWTRLPPPHGQQVVQAGGLVPLRDEQHTSLLRP